MRSLIVSINLSLDGFMAGPRGELDWHLDYWDEEMAGIMAAQLEEADTILLGRITYEAMAAYWPEKDIDMPTTGTGFVYSRMMNSYRKIVFSSTLRPDLLTRWRNTLVINGNIAEQICRLKHLPGKDMIIYGSGSIVSALIKARCELVDEYRIWVHPVLIREGNQIFRHLKTRKNLGLVSIQPLASGVAILRYQPIIQQMGPPGR